MFWMLMLLAVADDALQSFSPVTALNQDTWLKDHNYPDGAFGWEDSGVTQADIFVDAEGRPQACYIVASSGGDGFERQTCAAAISRGKFKPATDEAGKPMNGMFRFRVIWRITGRRTPQLPADVTLAVAKLPGGQQTARVELKYMVDETGRITKCAVAESSGYPQLDNAACRAMPGRYTFAPARDKEGKAWPVVRTQSVGFEVGG